MYYKILFFHFSKNYYKFILIFSTLSDLIDNHKSLHGDAPTGRTQQSGTETSTLTRGRVPSVVRPASSSIRLDAPHSCASWRKTYSLKNKNPPQRLVVPPSIISSSGCSASSGVIGARGRGGAHAEKKDDASHVSGANVWKRTAVAPTKRKADGAQHHLFLRGDQKSDVGVEKKQEDISGDAATSNSSQLLLVEPSIMGKTNREATTQSTSSSAVPPPSAPLVQTSQQPSRKQRPQMGAAFLRTSQFTWVKKRQGIGGAEEKLPPAALRATPTSSAATPSRKTPGRKSLRRRNAAAAAAHKTSKYKWVAASSRVSRKWASPKLASPLAEKAELLRKGKAVLAASVRGRKDTATSRAPLSVSSRYCWQAAGPSGQQGAAAGRASAVSRRRSTVWLRGGLAAHSSSALRFSPLMSSSPSSSIASTSSPGAFKLRSKMKIIRRSASR